MDNARDPVAGDDGAPRPRLLWLAAARVGAAVTAVVATLVDLRMRITHREPRRATDIERARRARAVRLIKDRIRDDGRR